MSAAEIASEIAPRALVERAQSRALNGPTSAEDLAVLQSILQAWWNEETDPRVMARWLCLIGQKGGTGSREHRRVTRIACLCARSVAILTGPYRAQCEQNLAYIEAWAAGNDAIPLHRARMALLHWWDLARRAENVASAEERVAAATSAAVASSFYACEHALGMEERTAIELSIAAAADAPAHLDLLFDTGDMPNFSEHAPDLCEAWSSTYDRHMPPLADLIRFDIPTVPLPGNLP